MIVTTTALANLFQFPLFKLLCIVHFQVELLKQLSDILKHGGNSQVARMQAGIQLKNALYSKDQTLRVQYISRWLSFPEDVRIYIKKNVSVYISKSELIDINQKN